MVYKMLKNLTDEIVFIILALALVYLTVIGLVDPKDFIILTTMAFMFFYKRDKEESSIHSITTTEKNTPEKIG